MLTMIVLLQQAQHDVVVSVTMPLKELVGTAYLSTSQLHNFTELHDTTTYHDGSLRTQNTQNDLYDFRIILAFPIVFLALQRASCFGFATSFFDVMLFVLSKITMPILDPPSKDSWIPRPGLSLSSTFIHIE